MISVIIPFFNAKEFIIESVNSANKQELVSEILVVYDGCHKISFVDLQTALDSFRKAKLIHHKEFRNYGSGASRNLGIQSASNKWIAFLDADDYFLGNRFTFFEQLLAKEQSFDGIYEAAIYEESKKLFTVRKKLNPPQLLHYLIRGTYGHFCTDGIIVKKELCIKAGMFNEHLRLHQDTEFWLRLAYYGILVAGDIENPVSVIRKHDNNRIWKGTNNLTRLNQWKVTWSWAWNKPIGLLNKFLILRKLLKYKIGTLGE